MAQPLKYPITPDYIAALPAPIVDALLKLEEYLLSDIASRLAFSGGDVSATALRHIETLQRRGYDLQKINKLLANMTGLRESDLEKAINDCIKANLDYYGALYEAAGADAMNLFAVQAEIQAIADMTNGAMKNITQSLGFSVRNSAGIVKWMPPAEAYQAVLDEMFVKVNSGLSYESALRSGIAQLADSGIQTVQYVNIDGVRKQTTVHADVAARRAVMTGITQISEAYANQAMTDLNTSFLEVTAHSGARDVDKPNPWSNHKAWQGKVYSLHAGDKYPSVYAVCGLGEVDGLCGANCRHTYHPFIDGISQRTYTDEELANIDKPPQVYNGRKYTHYQATQVMRKAESTMRNLKRKMIAESAAGDREKYLFHAAKFKTVDAEYKKFVNAMGLRSQRARGNIIEWGPRETAAAEKALIEAATTSKNT